MFEAGTRPMKKRNLFAVLIVIGAFTNVASDKANLSQKYFDIQRGLQRFMDSSTFFHSLSINASGTCFNDESRIEIQYDSSAIDMKGIRLHSNQFR